MGGKYITRSQAELYMQYRQTKELSQEASAAKSDISVRTGRTIEKKQHHTNKPPKIRGYKTRKSPLDEVWDTVLVPMLINSPSLQPKTLLLYLQKNFFDNNGVPKYSNSIERTLQRRVSQWQAINGQSKEVMFPQVHIPGQQGLSDFSHFTNAEVTIKGSVFKHMFYHFRLVYSKWSYIKVIQSGESMQALSEGLQEALFFLGGAPQEHRTDSLSAAFKNLSKSAREDLTVRYRDLCSYYNMEPTRNNKGKKHENGSVESAHGHLKNRISQELILRGSNDFTSIEEYETWVHRIVSCSNKRNAVGFDVEKSALQELPRNKIADFDILSVKVTSLSIIIVKSIRYSVPSSFSGHTLTLHIYQRDIVAYLGSTMVFSLDRKYEVAHKSKYVVDYKHIVQAMLKKPGAFRNCKYRNEILPNDDYRNIWGHLDKNESKLVAPKIMLRLLKLAANSNCEASLAAHVLTLIHDNKAIDVEKIEALFDKSNPKLPVIICEQHNINSYDFLINQPSTGDNHAGI